MGINISNKSTSMKGIQSNNTKQKDIKWFSYNSDYQDNLDYNATDIIDYSSISEPSAKMYESDNTDDFKKYEIYLNERSSYLNDLINRIDNTINKLHDDYLELIYKVPKKGMDFDTNSPEFLEYQEMEDNIVLLKGLKKRLEEDIALIPYQQLAITPDFINYVNNYDCDYQDFLDYDLLSEAKYDLNIYDSLYFTKDFEKSIQNHRPLEEIDRYALIEHILKYEPNLNIYGMAYLSDEYDKVSFMTLTCRMMYHYLFTTKGNEEADKFLALLEDKINQAKAQFLADALIKHLEVSDKEEIEFTLKNIFCVSGQGVFDGIQESINNIGILFSNDEHLTVEEYKKIIILDYLQEHSDYFDDIYNGSISFGKMIPKKILYAIISHGASAYAELSGFDNVNIGHNSVPFSKVAGKIVEKSYDFMSMAGELKHNSLINGSDDISATLYGIVSSGYKQVSTFFLNDIPNMSTSSKSGLYKIISSNVSKATYIRVDAGLKSVLLGENIDLKNASREAAVSCLKGILLSSIIKGGPKIIRTIINGSKVDVEAEKILEYVDRNPGEDVLDAIKTIQPELYRIIFG